MTHFATADELDDDLFAAQLEEFRDFVDEVGRDDLLVHAANSAAALRDPASHFDMVRCGVAIYGLDPFQADPAPHGLEPALSLHSWVASLRRIEPGQSVGYGRRWRAQEPTWVATVPVGYGDGWRRALTNNCDVLDPRPPAPAGGHGEHGQRDGCARRGAVGATLATRWS